MLIPKNNGKYIGGRNDVICILNDENTGVYHAAFFEEAPMPGDNQDLSFVRLKSKMHHTGGASTIEEAITHVEQLIDTIEIPEKNVWLEPRAWDGEKGVIWIVEKW